MRKLILFILLVAAASIIQNTQLFSVYGIKPDITLVVLLTAIPFVTNFLDYLILVFSAGILLQAPAGFLIVSSAAYLIGRRLIWRQSLNNAILIISATIVFYLLSAPLFLYKNWNVVLAEIIYNLILGGVFYFTLWSKRNHI
ncbi:MAG: hypothetical protein AAB454_00985 [Patescibacteria group bacterium]